jgi:hypothetical protein
MARTAERDRLAPRHMRCRWCRRVIEVLTEAWYWQRTRNITGRMPELCCSRPDCDEKEAATKAAAQ